MNDSFLRLAIAMMLVAALGFTASGIVGIALWVRAAVILRKWGANEGVRVANLLAFGAIGHLWWWAAHGMAAQFRYSILF